MPRFVSNRRYAAPESFELSNSQFASSGVNFAALEGGGFVALWMEQSFGPYAVKGQIFDANGREVGAEFAVNPGGNELFGAVAEPLPGGGFVIVWVEENPYPGVFDVTGQLYDASGATVGAPFPVNTTTDGFQVNGKVTALAGGGFVVVWEHTDHSGFAQVRAQIFAANGTKIGGEFVATDSQAGDKVIPVVTGLAGGGFVVGWFAWAAELDGSGNLSAGSRAQVFDAAGNKLGAAFALNGVIPGLQGHPALAALPSGGFVAAWYDNGNPNSFDPHPENQGIWIQRFDAAGAKVGDDVKISTLGPAGQDGPSVEVIPGKGFIVAWRDNNGTPEDGPTQLRGQIFDFSGNKTGEEFNISPAPDSELPPVLTVLAGGTLVAGWTSLSASEVRAQMLFAAVQGTEGNDNFAGTQNRDFYLGEGGNDIISGDAEDDGLDGGAGDDVLNGGAGNDVLDGGAGNDTMSGGTGDDTYYVAEAGDLIQESVGGGFDSVYTTLSWTLGSGIEIEILATAAPNLTGALNLTGNEFGQALVGNAGANILNGGGGADVLIGLGGNDTYIVDSGDQVTEAAGGGSDYVIAAASYVLNAGAEVELISTASNESTAAISLTGNEFAQVLVGNAGANYLYGGGGGADLLVGLGGNDTYLLDSDDRVSEAAGGGADYVITQWSFVLNAGAEVELVSTTNNNGTEALDLTGNAYGQVLVGNGGVNNLNGGGGADLLVGLGGNDSYLVDADDRVVEAVGGGSDYIAAKGSFILEAGSEVELLSTTDNGGTAAINLTGNAFNQALVGNAGANYLDGSSGADLLVGLAGNDTFIVEGDDRVIEGVGGGFDYIAAKASFILEAGAEIELISTTDNGGSIAINLTGNELGQSVIGNAGANVLDGKAGADFLLGLGGADSFAFTSALGGGNVDTLGDFSAADDNILLDDAVFAALAPGGLNPNAFVIGAAATTADHRIVYNGGQLFYDADGSGAGAAILFATLSGAPVITAGDFTII